MASVFGGPDPLGVACFVYVGTLVILISAASTIAAMTLTLQLEQETDGRWIAVRWSISPGRWFTRRRQRR